MWGKLTSLTMASGLQVLLVGMLALRPAAADDSREIGLDEAISKTLAESPVLRVSGHTIAVQQGRVQQAGLAPNPELDLLVENFAGSGTYSGFDGAETTLSIAWVVERGKRERRVEAAEAGLDLLSATTEIERLDAAAATARIFLDCLANQERLVLAGEETKLAETALQKVRERVDAGAAPEAERSRAQATLIRAALHQSDLRQELATSYRRLAAQWGALQPSFERVAGKVQSRPVPEDFAALVARLETNPDLARYLSEQRLREAELRLAEARARQDWRAAAGLRRFEEGSDFAVIASLSIPLAIRDRNEGGIAEARARLDQAESERQATRIRLESHLLLLHQDLTRSLERADVLDTELLPQVERALADTERAYGVGRYAYSELRLAQAEVLMVRMQLLDARVEAHRNAIEIERLTGTTLLQAATQP